MRAAETPLLQCLRDPALMLPYNWEQWSDLIRQARRARVLARLAHLLEEQKLLEQLPEPVRDHFLAAQAEARQHQRQVRWEVNRIRRALRTFPAAVVLLKGAAYVMAELPPARGRLVSDVDILVPQERLHTAERLLLDHDWDTMKVDAYDQRYYRTWMHELPPMRHRARGSVIDVHHNILPVTGRIKVDAERLIAKARALPGEPRFHTLHPCDMVLHAAAHMFQDGELDGSIRDLTDLDDLLRHFGTHEPDFWEKLPERAAKQGLQRSLYYAVTFSERLLGTPVPAAARVQLRKLGPGMPVRGVMNWLVVRSVLPENAHKAQAGVNVARLMLYVRSHWLRMPPKLLAGHLYEKAKRRWFPVEHGEGE